MDLERELLDAFDRYCTKTFPILSASIVQSTKSCSSSRNSPRTLNFPTCWITFDGALRVLMS